LEREITIPEVGTRLYKICPQCTKYHYTCNNSCTWFGVENPCNIFHTGYNLMIAEKRFHDGWRIKDLKMIGKIYFTTFEEAYKEKKRIEEGNHDD
jgi:hypothetical protein